MYAVLCLLCSYDSCILNIFKTLETDTYSRHCIYETHTSSV